MLIHVRKSWSLLLVFLIAAVLVIIINKAGSYENWIVTAMPFAVFHSAAYYYPANKVLVNLLHWVCFGVAIVINYLVLVNCQLIVNECLLMRFHHPSPSIDN